MLSVAAARASAWSAALHSIALISSIAVARVQAYKKKAILEMEVSMLNAVGFHVAVPTIHHFLVRFLKATAPDERVGMLAAYYAERMLQVRHAVARARMCACVRVCVYV